MRRHSLAVGIGLSAALLVSGCGGDNGATNTSPTPAPATTTAQAATPTAPADVATATAQIKANWAKFFNSKTPPAQAEALLQDASSLKAALTIARKAQAQTKASQSARVTAVQFVSPIQANVTYALMSNGAALLPNATGQAVLEGGVWKVSKTSFCSLVALASGGTNPPGC